MKSSYVLWIFLILFSSIVAHAQAEADGIMEYSFGGGSLLPDQIDDVSEINGFWGIGAGLVYSMNTYSVIYRNSTGDGNQLHNLALDYRTDVDLSSLKGTISGGASALGIKSPSRDGIEFTPAVHVGGGIMAEITKGLYFKMNMQFTAGTAGGILMFLDFGFAFRPAEDI